MVAIVIDGIYYYIIFHWLEGIYDVGSIIFNFNYNKSSIKLKTSFYQPIHPKVSETVNPAMDPKLAHFLKVVVATVLFHLIDRQSEFIQRVGFMQVKCRLS